MLRVLIVFLLVAQIASVCSAAVPTTIAHQGYLSDSGGSSVVGPVEMTFAIYDVETGGTALWTESQTVQVANGIYAVALGAVTPIDPAIIDEDLWLGVTVGADTEMSPRQKLGAVPFALKANHADSVLTNSSYAQVNGSRMQAAVAPIVTDRSVAINKQVDSSALFMSLNDVLYNQTGAVCIVEFYVDGESCTAPSKVMTKTYRSGTGVVQYPLSLKGYCTETGLGPIASGVHNVEVYIGGSTSCFIGESSEESISLVEVKEVFSY